MGPSSGWSPRHSGFCSPHLFDPVLAVHTSLVEPLPHQVTAVYEAMLPRQPLRFLLADDPGAGKTIMAGLFIKELIARGDLKRCLVVCPGSLAEQWQDELYRRFHLPFEILTNDALEAARTGNWFLEHDLAIARLDKLSRNEDVQDKLRAPNCGWDLIVCDEAHKMSATFFGGEVKYTKRYKLGQVLREDVEANAEDIEANQSGIDSNRDGVTRNRRGTDANRQGVLRNGGAIESNQQGIARNEANIIANQQGITDNRRDIGANLRQLTSLSQNVDALRSEVDQNRAGVSMSMAMANIPYSVAHRFSVGIGLGAFGEETSFAAGGQFKLNGWILLRGSIAKNGSDTGYGAGVGIGF